MMKILPLFIGLLSLISISSHPSIKELDAKEWKQRFANTEADLDFYCSAEGEVKATPMTMNYDAEADEISCNCPEGASIKIKAKDESLFKQATSVLDFEAVAKFMEMQDLKLSRFSIYAANYEYEYILESQSADGSLRYWKYEIID
jgi:hypothetical protein